MAMIKDELEFTTLDEDQVIKVPNCTFFNEIKHITTFFFCQCSEEEFYPVCKSCAEVCHKSHNPALKLDGIFECQCGKCNHSITKEADDRIHMKKTQRRNVCAFSSFYSITPSNGYYNVDTTDGVSTLVCSTCLATCCSDMKIANVKEFIDSENAKCLCGKHYEFNPVNGNLDFMGKFSDLNKGLLVFNFNIFLKVSFIKEKYIDTLRSVLLKIFNKNLSKSKNAVLLNVSQINEELFAQIYNFKAFEISSFFSIHQSKFFYPLPDLINDLSYDFICKLISYEPTILKDSIKEDYVVSRFLFSCIMFEHIIKSPYVANCNLFSVHTILNMNLFQRFIYFQKGKEFHELNPYKSFVGLYDKSLNIDTDPNFTKENPYITYYPSTAMFDDFMGFILDLYDIILKINETFDIKNKIFAIVFPKLNVMFKFMIKYNLISYDIIKRYVELVIDTVSLAHDLKKSRKEDANETTKLIKKAEKEEGKSDNSAKLDESDGEIKSKDQFLFNTEYDIVKSLFYMLLHRNDRISIEYYLKEKDKNNKQFVFVKHPVSQSISKVFVTLLSSFNRTIDLRRTLIFDFYVSKFMEMMIGANYFYILSMENLRKASIQDLKMFTKGNLINKLKKELKENLTFDFMALASVKLLYANKALNQYRINYDQWFLRFESAMESISSFLKENFDTSCILSKNKYEILSNNLSKVPFNSNPDYQAKLMYLQTAIRYSDLITRLNEAFEYHAKNIRMSSNNSNVKFQSLNSNHILDFIRLLYLLLERNTENLSLIMNLNFKNLLTVMCYYAPEEYFMLIDYIGDMYFLGEFNHYKLDNLTFFFRTINLILDNIYSTSKTFSLSVSAHLKGNDRSPYKESIFIFYFLDKTINILRKGIQSTSISELTIFSSVQKILSFFAELKQKEDSMYLINQFLNNQLETTNWYKDAANAESKSYACEVLCNFLSGYFLLLNELISNDYFHFKVLEPAHFIIELSAVDAILRDSANNRIVLPFKVEAEIIRFFVSLSMDRRFDFFDTKKQLRNLFIKGIPSQISPLETNNLNTTLNFLSIIDSEVSIADDLRYRVECLIRFLSKFDTLFQKCFTAYDTNNNRDKRSRVNIVVEKKICLLRYYEFCVIRPVFSLFNSFLIDVKQIRGESMYLMYDLVFHLLKATYYLYKNIVKISHTDPESNLLLTNTLQSAIHQHANSASVANNSPSISKRKVQVNPTNSKLQRNQSLTSCPPFYQEIANGQIFDFEEITVKSELNLSVLNDIHADIIDFSSNKIKYFEILKVQDKLLHLTKAVLINGLAHGNPTSLIISLTNTKQTPASQQPSLQYEFVRLEELIDKYKAKLASNYDNDLAFISNFELSDSEIDLDLGEVVFKYFLMKFCDKLTYANIDNMVAGGKYSPGCIDTFTINDFQFQNSYVLSVLNSLFYHSSSVFQELLSDAISSESQKKFLLYLSENFVFSNLLCEAKKSIEIDHVYPQTTLAFDLGTKSIKFLQNMCEAHNSVFQDKLFNICLDLEDTVYNYSSFYPNDSISYKQILEDRRIVLAETQRNFRKTIINSHHSGKSASKQAIDKVEFEEHLTNNSAIKDDFNDIDKKKSALSSSKNVTKEMLQKMQQSEEEINKMLLQRKFTLVNLYFHSMRIIVSNSNIYPFNPLCKITALVNKPRLQEFYQRFSDLIVEMLQGTPPANFNCIYRKLPDKLNLVDENGNINYSNEQTLQAFSFCYLILEVRELLFDSTNTFNSDTRSIKQNLFFTINNIINQELSPDKCLVNMLTLLLPSDKIISVISDLLRGIYIKHYYFVEYGDDEFPDYMDYVEFTESEFDILIKKFKHETDIYEDEFFGLASQMFLYIKILGAKYEIMEANKIFEIGLKSVNKSTVSVVSNNFSLSEIKNFMPSLGNDLKEENTDETVERKKKPLLFKRVQKFPMNNLIITIRFFNKITRSCEFMLEDATGKDKELKLKKIYFILDPKVYLISKSSIRSFLNEVDRSTSTAKLKGLLSNLNVFISEIEFKYTHIKKSKLLKWMLEVDYSLGDRLNFLFAISINLILLTFLDDGYKNDNVYYFVCSFSFFQTIMNIVYLCFFLLSKWRFYVILQKANYDSKNLSYKEKAEIYIFNSFLFNEDVYIMILNILVGMIATWTQYTTFLFSLQLFSIIKFVPAVQQIVIAFKMRIGQLISMIGFLLIILFVYANIGFEFYYDEFNINIGEDHLSNICSTLLECTITYFNLGVRSGGGIGDQLNPKMYKDSIYWIRWLTDMIFYITVILLLLNMVNGVIVSTFSQIREENNAKEEDINNKCFICSIDRLEFEKKKISFKDHSKSEHNIKTYIKYLVWLKLMNEKDLDADQSFIRQCIKQEEISCFPVMQSSTLGDLNQDEENDNKNDANNDE